jgi:two-component system, LytTR family, response regulator
MIAMKTFIHIGGRKCVNANEVIALVAAINYSLAYMHDGQVIVVATTLKKLENRFDSDVFFRVHKSCMINLNYLSQYDFQTIEMKNHLKAPISRRKRGAFERKIREFGIIIPNDISG